MKNSNSATTEPKKANQKKTALDNFSLFYEEVPLVLENRTLKPETRAKDRLSRRSRIKN